jgi:hypothetical protein
MKEIKFGSLYEELSFAATKEVTNLDYKRRTASYVELQSKFDKVSVIVGRAEDYNITGKTDKAELTAFKQFRFFQMQCTV